MNNGDSLPRNEYYCECEELVKMLEISNDILVREEIVKLIFNNYDIKFTFNYGNPENIFTKIVFIEDKIELSYITSINQEYDICEYHRSKLVDILFITSFINNNLYTIHDEWDDYYIDSKLFNIMSENRILNCNKSC